MRHGPGFHSNKGLKPTVVAVLADRNFDLYRLIDYGLTQGEWAALVPTSGGETAINGWKSVKNFYARIPKFEIDPAIVPISQEVIKVEIKLRFGPGTTGAISSKSNGAAGMIGGLSFEWNEMWNGASEPFHVWITEEWQQVDEENEADERRTVVQNDGKYSSSRRNASSMWNVVFHD